MSETHVVVECRDCSFAATHDRLRDARVAVADHESATDHAVDWTVESIAAGVSRAGADAGVCGCPEQVNEDSPLVKPESPDRA